MKTDILQFKGKTPVRMQVIKGEPWFVAKDVCDILGLTNSRKATSTLRDDEKGVTISYVRSENGIEQNREMTTVNESGMYSLIFKSRKQVAQDFRYWVTSEVLPCIRKFGSYALKGSKEHARLEARMERKERQQWLAELSSHLTYTDHEVISRRLHTSAFNVRLVLSGHHEDTAIESELLVYAARNAKLRKMFSDSEWRNKFINQYLNK